jgi:DNA-binding MarR family transcriptional regulator
MTEPSAATIQAWARLLRAQHVALSIVECALQNAEMPPLAWYDVLLELEHAGRDGIRPFELQGQLLLPQYRLSRLLERIANAGYLEKLSCEEDGRGQLLLVTRSGKNIRRRMWSIYSKAIQEAIGSKLTQKEIKTMSRILKQLS